MNQSVGVDADGCSSLFPPTTISRGGRAPPPLYTRASRRLFSRFKADVRLWPLSGLWSVWALLVSVLAATQRWPGFWWTLILGLIEHLDLGPVIVDALSPLATSRG